MIRRIFSRTNLAAALPLLLACMAAAPVAAGGVHSYRITLENMSSGQPLSPAVAATHSSSVSFFDVGKKVSGEMELLAENGDQGPLVWLLESLDKVQSIVDLGAPLTPAGSSVGSFVDRASFEIEAQGGDRLSLATMLVCTNDGLTGIDRLKLRRGGEAYMLRSYDAGTEDNTEMSEDIVDACSALGPVSLAGDPNGNENDAVDSVPQSKLERHPGLEFTGDLESAHGWEDPVARLTVVRLGDHSTKKYSSVLSGFAESPPAVTSSSGQAMFKLHEDGSLKFKLKVRNLGDATAAHIHLGEPGINGPVVAPLFDGAGDKRYAIMRGGDRKDHDDHDDDGDDGDDNGDDEDDEDENGEDEDDEDDEDNEGDESEFGGRIDASSLVGGPFEGDFPAFIDAMNAGALYVNVHSPTYPGGEIRGQVGADE